MNRLPSILLLLCAAAASNAAASSSSPFSRLPAFLGVRGGGLFGGSDSTKEEAETAATDNSKTKYPAMTEAEIEDWMEHIPIFAVTDDNGAGVVLKPDDDTSVFYFFFNPLAANATLTQLMSVNSEMQLRVTAFSLGKVWFLSLNSDKRDVTLKKPDSDETVEAPAGVEYRLVPDTRDLLGARMLLTMTPEDGEKLKAEGQMTPELAQEAINKAMTESPKFKETFNEIPVFTIAQMRMQKTAENGEEGATLLPMYFSLQNMVGTWQQFMSNAAPEMQDMEPSINLLSLHELVGMMQKESEIDFRNIVLVPSAPDGGDGGGSGPSADQTVIAEDPMAMMSGATLGDI